MSELGTFVTEDVSYIALRYSWVKSDISPVKREARLNLQKRIFVCHNLRISEIVAGLICNTVWLADTGHLCFGAVKQSSHPRP